MQSRTEDGGFVSNRRFPVWRRFPLRLFGPENKYQLVRGVTKASLVVWITPAVHEEKLATFLVFLANPDVQFGARHRCLTRPALVRQLQALGRFGSFPKGQIFFFPFRPNDLNQTRLPRYFICPDLLPNCPATPRRALRSKISIF